MLPMITAVSMIRSGRGKGEKDVTFFVSGSVCGRCDFGVHKNPVPNHVPTPSFLSPFWYLIPSFWVPFQSFLVPSQSLRFSRQKTNRQDAKSALRQAQD